MKLCQNHITLVYVYLMLVRNTSECFMPYILLVETRLFIALTKLQRTDDWKCYPSFLFDWWMQEMEKLCSVLTWVLRNKGQSRLGILIMKEKWINFSSVLPSGKMLCGCKIVNQENASPGVKRVLKLEYSCVFLQGYWRIAFTVGEETQRNQYGQNKTVLVSLHTGSESVHWWQKAAYSCGL